MFTGIVQTTGRVVAREAAGEVTRLAIVPDAHLAGETRPPRPGDSIAVAGVCLTIADIDEAATNANEPTLGFDLVAETLRCTKLGDLAVNDRVNLEPAVAPNQPMGGHFMQGHVDALASVIDMQRDHSETRLILQLDAELLDYVTPKGSIAVDGVSLTIASVHEDRIEIALIPTTLNHTTLGSLDAGDLVNLETDMIARTVVHWLHRHAPDSAHRADTVTRQMLDDAGFDKMG